MLCAGSALAGRVAVLLAPEERDPKAGTHENQSPDHLDSRALPAGHLSGPSGQRVVQLAFERLRRARTGQSGNPGFDPSERVIRWEQRRKRGQHNRRLLLEYGRTNDHCRRRTHDFLCHRQGSATRGHQWIFLNQGASRLHQQGPLTRGHRYSQDGEHKESICAGGGRVWVTRRGIGDTGAVRDGPSVSAPGRDPAPGHGDVHPGTGAQAAGVTHC
jgi:hypothetical protein